MMTREYDALFNCVNFGERMKPLRAGRCFALHQIHLIFLILLHVQKHTGNTNHPCADEDEYHKSDTVKYQIFTLDALEHLVRCVRYNGLRLNEIK